LKSFDRQNFGSLLEGLIVFICLLVLAVNTLDIFNKIDYISINLFKILKDSTLVKKSFNLMIRNGLLDKQIIDYLNNENGVGNGAGNSGNYGNIQELLLEFVNVIIVNEESTTTNINNGYSSNITNNTRNNLFTDFKDPDFIYSNVLQILGPITVIEIFYLIKVILIDN